MTFSSGQTLENVIQPRFRFCFHLFKSIDQQKFSEGVFEQRGSNNAWSGDHRLQLVVEMFEHTLYMDNNSSGTRK